MRSGQWVVIALLASAAAVGGGIWYAQQYGFYGPIDPQSDRVGVVIVDRADGAPRVLDVREFQGIDAGSSPIRYRACFVTDPPEEDAAMPYPDPQPLVAPGWFGCFDAGQLTRDLESGEATAYLSAAEIRPDVDRIVAIYPDGRAYAWQEYNPKNPERGVMD